MRKFLLAALTALLVLAPAAEAKKAHGAKSPLATLSAASQSGNDVTLSITTDKVPGNFNPNLMWVANTCVDGDGNITSAQNLPVHDGSVTVYAVGNCTDWVWYTPDPETPISNVLTFSV